MFEGRKIKRALARVPKAEEGEKRAIADELVSYGDLAIMYTADELRYNRILYADAAHIFRRLYKRDYLDKFVQGLGDSKENIRLLFKETIAKGGPGVVPLLIPYLAHENHMTRRMAGELICELGDPSIVEKVVPFARHQNRDVKKSAMDVLCAFKSPVATAAILPLMDDADSWVRRKAIEAICKLKDPATLPALKERLPDEKDAATLTQIIGVIGESGGPADARELIPFIRHPDMIVRQAAVDAVIAAGDSSVIPALIAVVSDEDVNARRGAVAVLNGLKDPRSAATLIQALKDGDWWVREAATEALSDLGGGKISAMIMELLHDPDEGVRRSAVEFYCRVRDPAAFDHLLALLEDTDWWTREKAIIALGLVKDPRAIEPIGKLTGDREVVWSIPKALATIGGEAILKPLTALLSHAQKQVRMEALRAVATVEGDAALDLVKEMARDPDGEIMSFALKQLREKTGRIWLIEDVIAELDRPGRKTGGLVKRRFQAKPGERLSEAIMVVDMARSTDIADTYGDGLAFELSGALTELIIPLAEEEGLQFAKSTGDGYLMTFADTRRAIRVALRALDLCRARNEQTEAKRIINLRFSLNVGETRVDTTGDRLGAAVNMAFRIEGVRKEGMTPAPGGMAPDELPEVNRVLVTEAVSKELATDPEVTLRLTGFFELKGFTGLHRVYQARWTAPDGGGATA